MFFSDKQPWTSWLYFVITFIAVSTVMGVTPQRFTDKSFSHSTDIKGRTVSCDTELAGELLFPAETWSCYNIRVDGLHVSYPEFSKWNRRRGGVPEVRGANDSNLLETNHTNPLETNDTNLLESTDLGALCREMMVSHGYEKPLWTAFVSDPMWRRNFEEGVIFKIKDGIHQWATISEGLKFTNTIRCMGVS